MNSDWPALCPSPAYFDLRCCQDDSGLSTRLRRNWQGLPERNAAVTLNQFSIS